MIEVTGKTVNAHVLEGMVRRYGKKGAARFLANLLHHEVYVERRSRDKLTINPHDISFKALAKVFMSERNYEAAKQEGGYVFHDATHVAESTDPLRISDFFGPLGGQVVFAEIGMAMREADDVTPNLVHERRSPFRFERIPWLEDYPDQEAQMVRKSGEKFKSVGFGKEYVETDDTEEFGRMIEIERTDVFFERLGGESTIMQKARQIGVLCARFKQDSILRGGPLGQTLYKSSRYGLAGVNAYQTAVGGGPKSNVDWINTLNGNPLIDKESLRTLQHLFDDMVDPSNNRAIEITPTGLLTMPANWETAHDIINAVFTENRQNSGADNVVTRVSGNGLRTKPMPYKSARLRQLATGVISDDADEIAELYWYGDFKKAWGWLENMALEVVSHGGVDTRQYVESGVLAAVRASKMGGFYWRPNGMRYVARGAGTVTPP